MVDGTDSPAACDSGLDDVIAAYLEAEAQGPAPDRQELLDRHPALTIDLAAFFAEHDRMRAVLAPLTAVAGAAPPRTPADATLPPRPPDAVTESVQVAATVGATLPASSAPACEKGARTHLCEAPSGPFRQMSPDPFFALRTSWIAAHSNAEPRAMSRNRARSFGLRLPFPSAMFSGMDCAARSH